MDSRFRGNDSKGLVALAFTIVPAALVLAGCISTPSPVRVQHFTLAGTQPVQRNVETAPANNQQGSILRIADINAPNWLDSTNLYYRLAYKNGAQISAYSQSDWVAPPPVLIGNVLQSTLAASGRWKAILGPRDVAEADVLLKVELNDFEQNFAGQNQSAGVLDATATIVGGEPNRILAQRHFHIEEQAPSADAAGGVQALSEAAGTFAAKVRDWLAKVTS